MKIYNINLQTFYLHKSYNFKYIELDNCYYYFTYINIFI